MRWPRFAVLVLITTLLQASWVDAIAVTRFNVAPDLLLIVMVFFAIRCNPTEAIISSFVLGFAADIVATGFPMGPRIISFGLFGTGLAYMHRVITIRKMPHEALAILVSGFRHGRIGQAAGAFGGPVSGMGFWRRWRGHRYTRRLWGLFCFCFWTGRWV